GRDPGRRARRLLDRPAVGRERPADARRRRARPTARAGDRPDRQLVEPGALRQADEAPVGPEDRPAAPADRLPRQRDLPSDVPLRARLRPRRSRVAPPRRPALPDPAAGPLRALRVVLHVRALLRGAAADRSRAPLRGSAPERLGLDRRLRLLDRLLRVVAVHPQGRRRARAGAASYRADRAGDCDPARARPLVSLACPRGPRARARDRSRRLRRPVHLLLTLVLREE